MDEGRLGCALTGAGFWSIRIRFDGHDPDFPTPDLTTPNNAAILARVRASGEGCIGYTLDPNGRRPRRFRDGPQTAATNTGEGSILPNAQPLLTRDCP